MVFKFHTDLVLQQWHLLRTLIDSNAEVTIDGQNLDIPHILCVSRYRAGLSINSSAHLALEASRNALEQRLAEGEIIYGVNTGLGATADTRTTEMERLQHTLTRELSYGILSPAIRDHRYGPLHESLARYGYDLSREHGRDSYHLPWTWVRAAILIRINSLVKGCSAVRPLIVERMRDLLIHDIIPMIPLRGSISASGDLNPLAYVSGAIQGKPSIRVLSKTPQDVYADHSLHDADLTPVNLKAKEGLAVVNGTAVSTAAGVLALHDAHGLAVLSQILTSMSVEALNGTPESFDPFFAKSRPHPGQIESARNILAFLEGSKLAHVNNGTDGSLRQDRYSIRTASQWVGPVLEDLLLAHQQISIECNSATDNPLIDAEGNVLHGGNFQAKAVTAAMEKTRQSMQTIGRMLYTQCVEMINPATSRGLPPNLVAEDPSTSGIFKATDIHISALQAELGFLSNPMNHVQSAELGNQALNSLALISARYTHTSISILAEMVAAHLIALCQAVDLRAMHIQYLESYRPQFSKILTQVLLNPRVTPEPAVQASDLEATLWAQCLNAFDVTVGMDSKDRFVRIAKSIRSPFLDYPSIKSFSDPLLVVENFVKALEPSLQSSWCSHRDAYLLHGDASALLGRASRQLYDFVRRSLKIPFLSTSQILTPSFEDFVPEYSENGTALGIDKPAPTVGSYTGVVYRALRDGTLMKVVISVLEEIKLSSDAMP